MIGVNTLHIVFDSSGSFCELGKQHMLNYLGNTVMNLEIMSWVKVKFIYHIWNEEIQDVESVEKISPKGIANVEALQDFLNELAENEAIILITDGDFKGINKKSFKEAVNNLDKRFAVILAGYDAAVLQLKSLSPNCFFAEDMATAFKVLAG